MKVRDDSPTEHGVWLLPAPFQLAVTWTGSTASRGDSWPAMVTWTAGSATTERPGTAYLEAPPAFFVTLMLLGTNCAFASRNWNASVSASQALPVELSFI